MQLKLPNLQLPGIKRPGHQKTPDAAAASPDAAEFVPDSPPEGASPELPSPSTASLRTGFLPVALGGAALVLLLVFGGWLWRMGTEKETATITHVQACVDRLAQDFANEIRLLQQQLANLVRDPEVRQLLLQQDPPRLRIKETALAGALKGARQIRLVAFGYGGGTDEDTRILSYAGLDLVHQTERTGETTDLEVHRLGQEDMHLAMAAPVFADDKAQSVIGALYVALPLELLPAIQGLGGSGAQVRLQQRVEQLVATLNPGKGVETPAGEPDYLVQVPGTRLQAAAWIPPLEGWFGGFLSLWVVLAYLAAVVMFGALLWIAYGRARQMLVQDLEGLAAVAGAAAGGAKNGEAHSNLSEVQALAAALNSLLRALDQARAHPAPGVSAPAEAAGQPEDPASAFLRETQENEDWEGMEEPEEETAGDDKTLISGEESSSAAGPLEEAEPLDLGEIELDEILPMSGDGETLIEAEPLVLDEEELLENPLAEVTQRIFRAYDIRGLVDQDLSVDLSRLIGLAIGTEVISASGDSRVFLARDTRPSSEALSGALAKGLRETGCDVIDLDVAPTPVLYFATRHDGEAAGVMVTGSHNAIEYNGIKIVIGGQSLTEERLLALRARLLRGDFASGEGSYTRTNLTTTYIDQVRQDIAIARPFKVVLDCASGTTAGIAGDLYRAIDVEVIELRCDPDADFPTDPVPDPTRPECLEALRAKVEEEGADLGLAFDGDGDRLGVVDAAGTPIGSDRVLMLLAADVLSRNPGTDVVFDVKSSHHLATEILRNGGRPVMWRSGHAPIKAKLAETGALLGGEWTGHIVFQERWNGFDDALYAGARLLEVLALDPRTTVEVFADLPVSVSTPERFLPLPEGEAPRLVTAIHQSTHRVEGAEIHKIDGLRLEFSDGWALVRASNTQPALVFRFEGDDEAALNRIRESLRAVLRRAVPNLEWPF